MFEAFPALRKFVLLGLLTEHHVIERLSNLSKPLLGRAVRLNPTPRAASQKLSARCAVQPRRELILHRIWWKPQPVETILECLKSRAESGVPRLDTLKLKADWLLSESMSRKDKGRALSASISRTCGQLYTLLVIIFKRAVGKVCTHT